MTRLYKYQATGNDFILCDFIPKNPSKLAVDTCDRHFGIGADGLIYPSTSETGDIKMNYYNADGTIAPMCGNGMRTFAKFLVDKKLFTKQDLNVETLAGMIGVHYENDLVAVNLKQAQEKLDYPDVLTPINKLTNLFITLNDKQISYYAINLGTLHLITFVDNFNDLDETAEMLCHHEFFPKRINVNFVKVIDKKNIEVKTYERGVGWTLSCGTGSASSAYITHMLDLTNSKTNVKVPGGVLKVEVKKNKEVELIGPAQFIAAIEMEIPYENL